MAEPTPPRSSQPPQPAAPSTPPAAPASRRRGCGCVPFVVAGALAAVAAGGYLLALPTFEFTNELKGPVRLEIGQKVRLVNPGETVRIRLGRKLLVAQWALQRPLSADRQPMGEALLGSWVVPAPRGTLRRAAGPRLDTGDYFAPLITNATESNLRIVVNAGLDGALDCGCAVRPGAHHVYLGYYRLYRNSTVQATDPQGRRATFHDLGPAAQAGEWVVGLRFGSGDFR
jgi:hypothetical protein